ncbi:RES family NAD+ phosphorylase [Vibrio splendidus]|uniref:RES family NAD+ phosphorylase n=1 Tax=Vibrio splendidus TaxID=29497 RepID=UPI003D12E1BE
MNTSNNTGSESQSESKDFKALVEQLDKNDLSVFEMNGTYRTQFIEYDGIKSAALVLYAPKNSKQKGRWNGDKISIPITYLAKTPGASLVETFSHVIPDFKSARFYEDADLEPREMSYVEFQTPLKLIGVRKLALGEFCLSSQDIEGDEVYDTTQPLMDALYTKFGDEYDGIIYSSRWSGDELDCAAIWSHPQIVNVQQVPLVDFKHDGDDIYEILERYKFIFN